MDDRTEACTGINFLIRGIRNAQDFQDVQHFQSENGVMTLFMPQVDASLGNVSSSNFSLLSSIGITLDHYAPAFTREVMKMKTRGHLFIGLTGGMHSGKSTLGKAIEGISKTKKVPIYHIEMDSLVHKVYSCKDLPRFQLTRDRLATIFGNEIKNSDGTINKAKLGEIAYKPGTGNLQRLTDLLMSDVMFFLGEEVNMLDPGIVMIESAIFIERNLTEIVDDNMIQVVSSDTVRRARIAKNFGSEHVDKRINAQLSTEQLQEHILAKQAGQFDRLNLVFDGGLDLEDIDVITDLYFQLEKEYVRRSAVIRNEYLFIPNELKLNNPKEFLDEITRQYLENKCAYHNLEHIQEFLTLLTIFKDEMGLNDEEFVEFFICALTHDAIYVPGKHDNEEKSADFAEILYEKYMTSKKEGTVINIAKMVALTGYHGRKPKSLTRMERSVIFSLSEKEKFFLDLDMWILAAPKRRFLHYEEGIFQEYSSMVDRKTYVTKRLEFLRSVLVEGEEFPIYKSLFMRNKFEHKAKQNISLLIEKLEAESKE
jgi:predicted metal-dependent HD superfamily phosphohydrolase/dephospho-CoA kinase